MGVPIDTYLNISKVCQFLAADGNEKTLLFKGGSNRPSQSWLLSFCRNTIQWLYDLDPDNAELPKQANYMYSLCNPYVAKANQILGLGGSGQIINPSTGGAVTIETPNPQFRVGDPDALMTAGETMLTLNYSGVINPSLEVSLDGVEVPYGLNDVFSFTATYNANNVQIVFNIPVQNGWLFNIHMIRLVPV